MSLVSKALVFATTHHKDMLRKGTQIPYMAHLLNVCRLLAEKGCREEVLAAALLHDVVEDTPVTIGEVRELFGADVAFLVEGATELYKLQKQQTEKDGKETWEERKQHTLGFVTGEATPEQLSIILADKLDNAASVHRDVRRIGESVWKRFNATKEKQEWYYRSLLRAFRQRAEKESDPVLSELLQEFEREVNGLFKEEPSAA